MVGRIGAALLPLGLVAIGVAPVSVRARQSVGAGTGLRDERTTVGTRSSFPVGPLIGGILGGVVGTVGGGVLGYLAECGNGCNGEHAGLAGTGYGALLGETIGLAFGVHVGNAFRGQFPADVGASVAGVALAFFTVGRVNANAGIAAGVLAQMILTVVVERRGGNPRRSGDQLDRFGCWVDRGRRGWLVGGRVPLRRQGRERWGRHSRRPPGLAPGPIGPDITADPGRSHRWRIDDSRIATDTSGRCATRRAASGCSNRCLAIPGRGWKYLPRGTRATRSR